MKIEHSSFFSSYSFIYFRRFRWCKYNEAGLSPTRLIGTKKGVWADFWLPAEALSRRRRCHDDSFFSLSRLSRWCFFFNPENVPRRGKEGEVLVGGEGPGQEAATGKKKRWGANWETLALPWTTNGKQRSGSLRGTFGPVFPSR